MKNYIAIAAQFSGEYRYRLTGPDGEVKQECDWTPNLLLNTGLYNLLRGGITQHMALGTSTVPADVTQTTLQGTYLGIDTNISLTSRNTPVGPNWERTQLKTATFPTGVGTGTINEFILTNVSIEPFEANIRVVLTAPIVKGVLDELTIQHRVTYWPKLTDVDDVINISGVAYNVKLRMFYGLNNQNSMDITAWETSASQHPAYRNATLPADLSVTSISGTGVGSTTGLVRTYGGTVPDYWSNLECIFSIDHAGGDNINVFQLSTANAQPKIAALVTKVSDGTGIDKPNTHELRLNWRIYAQRYTP